MEQKLKEETKDKEDVKIQPLFFTRCDPVHIHNMAFTWER